MSKEYVIPVFVPHLGCPNDCIFCNQKSISGQKKKLTKEDAKKTIEYFLENIKDKDAKKEIAFFGGSFTGIDEKQQEELLQIAYEYIKNGQVESIRISTRPDYINKEILKRLKKYKVKTIELGVQSANDYILGRANRGHTFKDVEKASKLIRWYGFNLGHQMMVGLPESSRIDEINTAKALIKLKPKMIRIYPVLVIKGTKLEKEYNNGGPDNLWGMGDNLYYVIECKNESNSTEISKRDCGQLHNSKSWFYKEYGSKFKCIPIIIHRNNKFEKSASPEEDFRILDKDNLDLLKENVQKFAIALCSDISNIDNLDILLKNYNLTKDNFINYYTIKV